MRKTLINAASLGSLVSLAAVSLVVAAPSPKTRAPELEFVQEVFIDFGSLTHPGPGSHPTTESGDYQLSYGGAQWFAGGVVEYAIMGVEPTGGANTALENAVATWDSFVMPRAFNRNDATTQTNPCTGAANAIEWGSLDGTGSALAVASVCRNVATKEIVGFVITMDNTEPWSVGGSSTTFDIENVASHEAGHVAGLGHVNAPKSGCLTLYKFAGLGEIQKRTLGLGDKLGMNALYGSADLAAGSCGS